MPRFTTILDALDHWADLRPNDDAFIFLDGKADIETRLSFADLQLLARRAAADFHDQCKVGSTIALIMPTSPEFVVAFFACLYAGVLPVPLSQPSRHNGLQHLKKIFTNSGAKLCLSHKNSGLHLADDQHSLSAAIQVVEFSLDKIVANEPLRRIRTQAENVAFLQYTSGSTSAPKGVTVTHGNIVANQEMIIEVFGHTPDTRQLTWMPLYHDMGLVGHVLQPIYNGTVSYLMDPVLFVQRPRLWLQAISRYRITSTGGPNFCYQHCAKRVKPETILGLDFSCLKVAYNGAEPISAGVLDRFSGLCESQGFSRRAFLPCFGLAEATLMVSGIRHSELPIVKTFSRQALQRGSAEEAGDREDTYQAVSLGSAAAGETLLIMNTESSLPCPALAVGEVWISGDNVTQGYWRNAEATNQAYVWYQGHRYLRTGDLGFLDQHQHLYITGRAKDLIIIDGKNHYPQDVEFCVQEVDTLLRPNGGAAFSISRADGRESMVVVQELERAYRNRERAVIEELALRIKEAINREHALPVAVLVLVAPNSVPKTTSGKIRRALVKQMYLEGAFRAVLDELDHKNDSPIEGVKGPATGESNERALAL